MDDHSGRTSKTSFNDHITMKYNENLPVAYGIFSEIYGKTPVNVRPHPSKDDYTKRKFSRVFARKINDSVLFEISGEQISNINARLYQIIYVSWTITGPRENKYMNGIITPGVQDQNIFEIDRVMKEDGVDLKKVLPNPLEYWQGR